MIEINSPLNKYYKLYIACYVPVILVFTAFELLNIEAPSIIPFMATVFAAMATSEKFKKDHGRRPIKNEKRSLVWRNILHQTIFDIINMLIRFSVIIFLDGGLLDVNGAPVSNTFIPLLVILGGALMLIAINVVIVFIALSIIFRTGKQTNEETEISTDKPTQEGV